VVLVLYGDMVILELLYMGGSKGVRLGLPP
jgi:hypothetical protein